MSYIDIAIIALIVLSALLGLWKGGFKTMIGMFGGLVALVLAMLLAKHVAIACIDGFAKNWVLGAEGSIRSFVGNLLPDAVKELAAGASEVDVTTALGSGIFGFLFKPLAKTYSALVAEHPAITPYDCISCVAAFQIFTVIVAVALFIIARLLMCLFTMFAKSFAKDGKPNGLSRALGALLGAVRGLVYACVLLLIASFFTGLSFMSGYNEQMDKSVLAKPLTQFSATLPAKSFNDEKVLNRLLIKAELIGTGEDVDQGEPEGGEQGGADQGADQDGQEVENQPAEQSRSVFIGNNYTVSFA